jgi:hypothetical protein
MCVGYGISMGDRINLCRIRDINGI